MEIILILLFLIVCSVIGFIIGQKTVKHQEQLNNDRVLEERALLEKDIESKQNKVKDLNEEYNNKKEFIDTVHKAAEDNYNKQVVALHQRFQELEEAERIKFQEQKDLLAEELEVCKQELNSMKATRAATVEAFRREQDIKSDVDSYRLDINAVDKQDINILNTIKFQLSRPRILCMLIWQTYFQPIAKKKFPIILGGEKICGIYKITNIKNDMCYIGQAVDVRQRFMDHAKCGLGIDAPQGNKLYQAMMEDGLENFTFELLESCSREDLNAKEKFYIDMFNSCDFGYNSQKGNS